MFVVKCGPQMWQKISRCFSQASRWPLKPRSVQQESTDTQICADTSRLAAKALYMKAVIKFVSAEAQAAALWVEELRGRFFTALKHENWGSTFGFWNYIASDVDGNFVPIANWLFCKKIFTKSAFFSWFPVKTSLKHDQLFALSLLYH